MEDHPINRLAIEIDELLTVKAVEIPLDPGLIAEAAVTKLRRAAHPMLRVGVSQSQPLKAIDLLGGTGL